MEALIMWLRGQGDSEKPQSWETLLKALRWAAQNDLANNLEKDIREGRLLLLQSFWPSKDGHNVQFEYLKQSNSPQEPDTAAVKGECRVTPMAKRGDGMYCMLTASISNVCIAIKLYNIKHNPYIIYTTTQCKLQYV